MKQNQQEVDLTSFKCPVQIVDQCPNLLQMSIDQLAQLLTDLRLEKLNILQKLDTQSEEKLGLLMTLFLKIKEQLNQKIDEIIQKINEEMDQKKQNIKIKDLILNQSIQNLSQEQLRYQITELRQEQQIYKDLFFQDEYLKNKLIEEYFLFVKQLNSQIKLDFECNQENISKQNENTPIHPILNMNFLQIKAQSLPKYESIMQSCYSMAIDRDMRILINGINRNIQIWEFHQDQTKHLIQTLNDHTEAIRCLSFSQKADWFISGSDDKSIRLWRKGKDDKWTCKQLIHEAHKSWVTGLVINRDEDQIISSSLDHTIKIWMEETESWECVQTLTGHVDGIIFLCLNAECKLLASSGIDHLLLWEKENNQIWKYRQIIEYSKNNHYYQRITFIGNDELMALSCRQGKILIYTLSNTGNFLLKQEQTFIEIEPEEIYCFSLLTNNHIGLSICRNCRVYTLVLKRQNENEFITSKVLQGHYSAGLMTKENKVILSNHRTGQLVLLK